MILLAAITPRYVLEKERHTNKSVRRRGLLSRPSYPAATPIDHKDWQITRYLCCLPSHSQHI